MFPISSRTAAYGLSILGAVLALVAALSSPTSFEVTRETGTEVIIEDTGVYPIGYAILVGGCLTAVLLVTALIATGRGATGAGKVLLLIAGIVGLVPLLVPGILILIARALLIRSLPNGAVPPESSWRVRIRY